MIDCGIYKIENLINRKKYVGSSSTINLRWIAHRCDLNNHKHYNPRLQNSWNKHGKHNFIFTIIEEVNDKEKLVEREQFWIDKLNPEYNICPIAGRTEGRPMSIEQRKIVSNFMIGNKFAQGHSREVLQETRNRISSKLKGTRHSLESYKRQGDKIRGIKHSLDSIMMQRISMKMTMLLKRRNKFVTLVDKIMSGGGLL